MSGSGRSRVTSNWWATGKAKETGQTMEGTTMAPRVVVVHDEVEFVNAVVTSLRVAGHQVTAFP
jgi:hypothetical protein